jgi:phosphatidylserine synthase
VAAHGIRSRFSAYGGGVVDHHLRPLKARLYRPLVRRLPISPDTVTLLALVAGVASAVSAAQQAFGVALALWWLNRTLDGLDGELARARRVRAPGGVAGGAHRGAYLDLMVDLVVYSAVPLGVAWGVGAASGDSGIWRAAAFALAAFYVNLGSWSLLSAALAPQSVDDTAPGIRMPAGLIEGTETLVAFTLLLLLPAHSGSILVVFAALTLLGAAQRTAWGLRHLGDARSSAGGGPPA